MCIVLADFVVYFLILLSYFLSLGILSRSKVVFLWLILTLTFFSAKCVSMAEISFFATLLRNLRSVVCFFKVFYI